MKVIATSRARPGVNTTVDEYARRKDGQLFRRRRVYTGSGNHATRWIAIAEKDPPADTR